MAQLSIFPKFLQPLALDDLGPRLRDAGLTAVNLVIRTGYWVEPGKEIEQVPRFVAAMRRAGVAVPFCTWCELPDHILGAEDLLRLFADQGITGFRLGYYGWEAEGGPLLTQLQAAGTDLARLTPALQRHGLRAVLQVHHGRLVPSPSCAAILMQDLPDAHFGVMPDIGNMGYEGDETPTRTAAVLGPYWSALGVKDSRIVRGPAGPQRVFCPCQEGDHRWDEIAAAYAASPGAGRDPWVLQPFYHGDDLEAHLRVLAEEVAFIRQQCAAALD